MVTPCSRSLSDAYVSALEGCASFSAPKSEGYVSFARQVLLWQNRGSVED